MEYDICELCGKNKPLTDHKRCKRCGNIKHSDSFDSFYHSWQQLKRHHNIIIDYEQLKNALYADYKKGYELHYSKDNNCIYLLKKADTSRLMNRNKRKYLPQGVYYSKSKKWYYWQMNIEGKVASKSNFPTAEAAARNRDRYIIENNINAMLSSGREYICNYICKYDIND